MKPNQASPNGKATISEASGELPPDPFEALVGASARLDQLNERSSGSRRLLSPGVVAVLEEAAHRLANEPVPDPKPTIVDAEAYFRTALTSLGSPFDGALRDRLFAWSDFRLPPIEPASVGDPRQFGLASQVILKWDLVEVLATASRLQRRTRSRAGAVSAQFMWGGALSTRDGQAALQSLGLFVDGFEQFRSALLETLIAATSAADRREFADYIRDLPDLRTERRVRPEYIDDRALAGRDALGSGDDSRALAGLLTLESAGPPMAVGVFGAWGSGKSTLLKQIQHQVTLAVDRQRRTDNATATADGTDPADRRIRNIIQVSLNAWTFADSANLWASITSEIFDQIASGGLDHAEAQRGASLVAEVAKRTGEEAEHLRSTLKTQSESQAAVTKAEQQVEKARNARQSTLADAAGQAVLALLGEEEKADKSEASKSEKSAIMALKDAVFDESREPSEKAVRRYANAAGDMTRVILIAIDYFWKAGWRRWAALLAVPVIGFTLWWGWALLLPHVSPAIGWVVRCASLLAFLLPVAPFLLPALRVAGMFNRELAARQKKADEELLAAKEQLARHKAAFEAAAAERSKREAYLAKYRGAAEAGLAGAPSLMLEFLLKDSADVAAVRAQLGSLAAVRRSFEQLSAVVAAGRRKETGESVERIIVYIDDLDRCTEAQVVQVLQAVHLLLAYDCFIAVVAVDAHWLQHALETVYEQFKGSDGSAKAADYLEKIFQIPFWVKRLRDPEAENGKQYHAYRSFVAAMIGSTSEAQTVPLARPADPTAAEPAVSRDWLERVEPFAPRDREEVTDLLALTVDERELLMSLGPIAAKSPRAVKRFVNLYRLIRASMGQSDIERFLSAQLSNVPSFAAVQLMLAIETGFPSAVVPICLDGIGQTPDELWRRIVEGVSLNADPLAPPSAPAWLTALTQAGLRNAFLEGVREAVRVLGRPIEPHELRLARQIVARYSFHP
ncbi:hypothetical protein GGR46_001145 [Sphingomonas kyeonggiensis]|uniref:KAP NTPase domain-containing protein n=1 Tax=Sphingomonas kyeonggiensis TaxID=1268553 RepID=A0A7W6NVL9_9SPHN|nr:hypothetical protein [Sphingomonas kyeonggiensis]